MFAISTLLFAHTFRVLIGLEPGPTEDEIAMQPTEVRYIAASWPETVVRGRPWVPHKRLATVSDGTRFVVRGVVESRDDTGCDGKPWYAVYPFGFICSKHAQPSKKPPELGAALALREGRRVPHDYVYVSHDGVPMYNGYDDVDAGVPSRPLTDGMSLVVSRTLEYDGREWIQTGNGALVPREGVHWGGQGSEWAGVELDGDHVGPSFAWTNISKGTTVRAAPESSADKVMKLGLRTRVPLLERASSGDGKTFWRVGEGLWIDAAELNEVHLMAATPSDVLEDWRASNTGNDQWIDVDLGEQTLVAYRGGRAVYATMISSGRGMPTPRGNYPIWAKVASTTMANQAYEDKPYMVQGVPWVLLFQGHNALHGAYWHDKFGNRKSHGCVNLAPYDARWVFEWAGPTLPAGWTGYLPGDLRRSVMVHVRDSGRADEFEQERPIGPPDREAEKARTEAAELRRADSYDLGPRYDPAYVPDADPYGDEPASDTELSPSGRLEPRTTRTLARASQVEAGLNMARFFELNMLIVLTVVGAIGCGDEPPANNGPEPMRTPVGGTATEATRAADVANQTGADPIEPKVMPERPAADPEIERALALIETSQVTFLNPASDPDEPAESSTGKEFASMLRTKWDWIGYDLTELDPWLDQIASRSFKTNLPYQVVMANGTTVEVRAWLGEELQRPIVEQQP